MDELARWLRKRLDEDERIARRAGDGFRQIGDTGVIVATEGDRAEECASANWAGVADHIVHHDPARVLREIDAKRRQIEWCVEVIGDRDLSRYDEFGSLKDDKDVLAVTLAVETLRLLALPFADREGYRVEWAPTE